MPLREFRDAAGVEWKVWDVTAESMHPGTSRATFVGEFRNGWLVMASPTERRRVAPIPADWITLPESELAALAEHAPVVTQRGAASTVTGEMRPIAAPVADRGAAATAAAPAPALDPYASRSFSGPSGRRWTASVAVGRAGTGHVLRFTSDEGRACAVDAFPADWERLSTAQLVALLEHAAPLPTAAADAPRRRHEDRVP